MNHENAAISHRSAWVPTLPIEPSKTPFQPPLRTPDLDDERARREALRELSQLIADLEGWRRRQAMRKPTPPGACWVFVRAADGASVRIRFERGRPVQLRTSSQDRIHALEVASAAVDLELVPLGKWARDAAALDWRVSIRLRG